MATWLDRFKRRRECRRRGHVWGRWQGGGPDESWRECLRCGRTRVDE